VGSRPVVQSHTGLNLDALRLEPGASTPGFDSLPKMCQRFLAINKLDSAALDVAVAVVEHFANLRHLGQIANQRIFDVHATERREGR
jgi:hypothetical protein